MRDGDKPRIRIILGKEEAEGAVANVESKTIFNGGLAKTEGRRILFGLQRLAIELYHRVVVHSWRAVFDIMRHTPQLAVEFTQRR